MFVGVFEPRVDANGRVTLPASFRERLGGECYLRLHPDGYLTFLPADEYQKLGDDLLAKLRAGEATEADLRALGAGTSRVAIDKQGRITLPEEARAHAGIGADRDVVVNGDLFWFSMWRPSRYATLIAEHTQAVPGRVWEGEDD